MANIRSMEMTRIAELMDVVEAQSGINGIYIESLTLADEGATLGTIILDENGCRFETA